MRSSRKLFSMCMVALFILTAAGIAFAGSQQITAKLNSGNYAQNADNFLVIFDRTGSMADQYAMQRKLDIEKGLAALFNATIPTVKLGAGLREIGQYNDTFVATNLDYGMTGYNRDALAKVVANMSDPFGNTPLDKAITAAGDDLKDVKGKIALVIFSDGLDMYGAPVVKAATDLKSKYGDRICIYTVQIGNDPAGAKILENIGKAGQCGVAVKGDSVANDPGMTAFVEKIFVAAKPPEQPKPVVKAPAPAPAAPAPAPAIAEKKAPAAAAAPEVKAEPVVEKIKLNILFDTNKAVIKPKYKGEVRKVADFMKKYPDTKATIEGHTDNVGKEAANVKLSQKRADAVLNMLVKTYKINKSRLKAVGYGPKKPVASNATAAGKQQNRRVEAAIEKAVK
ncbi:MAG: OmpA family protein [Syntrophaceae bacterium]